MSFFEILYINKNFTQDDYEKIFKYNMNDKAIY